MSNLSAFTFDVSVIKEKVNPTAHQWQRVRCWFPQIINDATGERSCYFEHLEMRVIAIHPGCNCHELLIQYRRPGTAIWGTDRVPW